MIQVLDLLMLNITWKMRRDDGLNCFAKFLDMIRVSRQLVEDMSKRSGGRITNG